MNKNTRQRLKEHGPDDAYTKELEARVQAMAATGKKKVLAGVFTDKDIPLQDEQKLEHFRSAQYLWNLYPLQDGPYKGLHGGLLLDEELDYIHLVIASIAFINYTVNL